MGVMKEFMEFLREYKVVPLAIAFIMGVAATTLVNALVNDIIMPLIGALIPGGDWRTATFNIGPKIVISWGDFVGALINFIIIAFVVFMIAKIVLKEQKVSKK